MRTNTIKEMADIIAAVQAGKAVECRSTGMDWGRIEALGFVGNFVQCEYRLIPPTPKYSPGDIVWAQTKSGATYIIKVTMAERDGLRGDYYSHTSKGLYGTMHDRGFFPMRNHEFVMLWPTNT